MAEDPSSDAFDQAAIDELLRQAGMLPETAAAPLSPNQSASSESTPSPFGGGPSFDPAGTGQGVAADAANGIDPIGGEGAAGVPLPDAARFELPNLRQVMRDAQASSIDLLRDVDLNVKIELGRSRMLVEDVLKLAEVSVVELDKLAGDPVDVFVNDRLVARGEVLVLNDNFCVRINEIVAGVKEEGL